VQAITIGVENVAVHDDLERGKVGGGRIVCGLSGGDQGSNGKEKGKRKKENGGTKMRIADWGLRIALKYE
jgi:hypothetical protein